ncbi:hypothetical protein AB0M02_06160 [Actinoplanes sp. NPDC051861]|uniref:hypothetical protein n=1 Tax=Actinoplanes sp. NPDC051861 TaxID=3155170 RepID=UPI0034238B08
MGASGWDYVTPYEPDLRTALIRLIGRVFESGEYYWAGEGEPPTHFGDLFKDEVVQEEGTHSILDCNNIIGPDTPDGFGTLRLLRAEESQRYFGSATPTREQWEKGYANGSLVIGERWCGWFVVLYRDGEPSEIAVWGISGD